jgi:predicted N-acetyltransferase YhbS
VIAIMPVETWDARSFTPAQAKAIGELINQVWPKPNLNADDRAAQLLALGSQYHGRAAQAPRSLVILEADRVVAHAMMLPRRIDASRGEMVVGGLARVCTAPAVRGRGLGEQVVHAAFKLVDDRVFPFALFQANSRVRAFYEKFGAIQVKNRIVNSLADDPSANPFWDDVVMRYPRDGNWPDSTIDLLGPGF